MWVCQCYRRNLAKEEQTEFPKCGGQRCIKFTQKSRGDKNSHPPKYNPA